MALQQFVIVIVYRCSLRQEDKTKNDNYSTIQFNSKKHEIEN